MQIATMKVLVGITCLLIMMLVAIDGKPMAMAFAHPDPGLMDALPDYKKDEVLKEKHNQTLQNNHAKTNGEDNRLTPHVIGNRDWDNENNSDNSSIGSISIWDFLGWPLLGVLVIAVLFCIVSFIINQVKRDRSTRNEKLSVTYNSSTDNNAVRIKLEDI